MAAVPHTAGNLARQSSAPARFALLRSGLGFEPCGSGGVALIPGPSPDEAGEGELESWGGGERGEAGTAWQRGPHPRPLPTKRERGCVVGWGANARTRGVPPSSAGLLPTGGGVAGWRPTRGSLARRGGRPPSSPGLLPTRRERRVGVAGWWRTREAGTAWRSRPHPRPFSRRGGRREFESRGGGQRREAGTAWPAHPRLRSGLGFDWREGSGVGRALRVPGTRTRTACGRARLNVRRLRARVRGGSGRGRRWRFRPCRGRRRSGRLR